jgi:membrane associated rhomboid family serine protease
MFLHAGWAHILGNMLYLWIFGDNIEDLLGHVRYLGFYLLCGVAGTLAQFAFISHSNLLILGASGAIAGVLGAYFILFAGVRIKIWLFLGIVRIEAWLAIGLWILYQVFLVWVTGQASASGGVAYMAHVGGFIAGVLLALTYRDRSRSVSR